MYSVVRQLTRIRSVRSGIRRRILNTVCPLDRMPSSEFIINLRGQKLSGNLRNAQDYAIYFGGAYEPFELDLIEYLTDQITNSVCLDIGCNMGQHTLIMAKRAYQVYAFDPLESVRKIAERRVEENDLTNVSFFDFGLGSEESRHEFYFDSESQNNAMGSFIKTHSASSQSVGELRVRKGDDVINEISPTRIDLIKIDVEGFEGAVMAGLRSTISQFQPFIMFEVTSTSMPVFEKEGVLNFLTSTGYEFYEIIRGKPRFGVFVNTSMALEKIAQVDSRTVGYNLLAVPQKHNEIIDSLSRTNRLHG